MFLCHSLTGTRRVTQAAIRDQYVEFRRLEDATQA